MLVNLTRTDGGFFLLQPGAGSDGALSKEALIALAVAHTEKCPYVSMRTQVCF